MATFLRTLVVRWCERDLEDLLYPAGGGRVVRRPGLEQVDDLRARVSDALLDRVEPVGHHERRHGNGR